MDKNYEHYHYTTPQVEKLLRFANSVPRKAVLSFLYWQGPRCQELCKLEMRNFDDPNNPTEVNIYGQKTRTWRRIPILDGVKPSLKEWLKMRKETLVPMIEEQGKKVPPNVFINQFGGPLAVNVVEKAVYRTAVRAGFEGIALEEAHPHTLRHSIATALYHEYHWDIVSAAYFMGHSVGTYEACYVHGAADACKRNAERMR